MVTAKGNYLRAVLRYCLMHGWDVVWQVADVVTLVTGVLANAALLWAFLRERRSLSASQVLGVNLAVMNLVYLSIMPVTLIHDTLTQLQQVNYSDFSDFHSEIPDDLYQLEGARDVFGMFILIGCPLLLACMCVERCLAVTRPVLYLRVRKWEYRVAVSAVVWVITLTFCLAAAFMDDRLILMVPLSIVISCLFIIMLACLGSMVRSLLNQSPAHTTHGHQAQPLKRQALGNVLVVVVPAVISYFPVLVMAPLVLYIFYLTFPLRESVCNVLELCRLLPRLGVLIGPLFYLSKAKQMCHRRT